MARRKTTKLSGKRPSDAALARILLKRACAPDTSYGTAPALLWAAHALIHDLAATQPPVEWRIIKPLMNEAKEATAKVFAVQRPAKA